MAGFIGVHIGAGNHPEKFTKEYTSLCKEACKKGAGALAEGRSALDAATEAVAVLEDSPWCNAGLGSSLTWNGTVECDAGAMEGTSRLWGGAGAVPGVRNPCQLARELCLQQSAPELFRIPPCLLVGQGATNWARKNGISTVDPSSLIHERALQKYHRYKKRIQDSEGVGRKPRMACELDTVGAVCIDGLGHTAAVCSSGGIALKECGRVGQAAVFGAGCWAEDWGRDCPGVASCTSGCGEHLVRCSLARTLASSVRLAGPTSCVGSLHQTMTSEFLGSPLLRDVVDPLGGALVLTCAPEDGCGEIAWTHTTASLALAHMAVHGRPVAVISRLPPHQTPGRAVVVGGAPFKLALTRQNLA